jgi:hypothetical protein
MRRRLATLAVCVAAPLLAACQPPFGSQMAALDRLVHHTNYDAWRALSGNGAALGRRMYPWLDWSTDGCSAPLVGAGPFDFTVPCTRHDLAWRNLRRLEARFDRDVWTSTNKLEADRRFVTDLRTRCGRVSPAVVTACLAATRAYATAVRLVPPYALPWLRTSGRFRW